MSILLYLIIGVVAIGGLMLFAGIFRTFRHHRRIVDHVFDRALEQMEEGEVQHPDVGLVLRPAPGEPDAALIRQGQLAAAKYRCGICHLADYRGRDGNPRLAGGGAS